MQTVQYVRVVPDFKAIVFVVGGGYGYSGGRNDGHYYSDGRYGGCGGGGERSRYHQGDSRHGGGPGGSRDAYGGAVPGPGSGSGFWGRGGWAGRGRYSHFRSTGDRERIPELNSVWKITTLSSKLSDGFFIVFCFYLFQKCAGCLMLFFFNG